RIDLLAPARGPIHGTQRLVELTQRLGGRIAALAAAAGLRARLLARLALLPFLALLALLTLLPRLTLLRGLRLLLRELLLHLLELAAKLLGLAAELLLLPAVALGQLLAAIRLTREVLLTAGELLKLADRLVDAALLLLERDRRFRLVLVLLEIHLELEQLGQIPPGEPAATAAVALERNLDVGEKRLGAQQMLQRRLLGRDRVLKLHSLEIFRRRIHRLGRELAAFDELPDLLVLGRQLSRARAVRERARLLGQRALWLGEHPRVVVQLLLVEEARGHLVALADQVPGRDEDLLLPARNLVLIRAAASAAGRARAARLRERALERLDLDEVEIGLCGALAILRDDVVRDQIAGLELRLARRSLVLGLGLGGAALVVESAAGTRQTKIVEVDDALTSADSRAAR